jgi:2-dehydropantoate 2-reductase
VRAIAAAFEGAKFAPRASERIVPEMWEKWVALSTTAGITCLMRAAIGDNLASPGGREAILALFAECREVARAAEHEPRPAFVDFVTGVLTTEGSTLTASMLRDIERGGPTEGEHILGDLVGRAEPMRVPTPLLSLARCHVAAYEARRAREQAAVTRG